MIKIQNLTKTFGKLVAVDNVSLNIGEKECFALLGFNGAGKTTLINLLTTVLTPTSGNATLGGFNLRSQPLQVKEIVNVSPQESAVAKNLTVWENLSFIADIYAINDKNEVLTSTLQTFDLTEKRNAYAKHLSGGQLKRLSLAMAVITKPKILFLDEPTLGLDVKARAKLWSLIKELKSEMTIVLTTHYLEEVEALTDKIAIISKGKIKAVGTLEELLNQTQKSTLEEAFIMLSEEDGE